MYQTVIDDELAICLFFSKRGCLYKNKSIKIYGNHLGLCAFHEKGCAIFWNFV